MRKPPESTQRRTIVLIAGFPAGAWGTNCYLVAPAAGEEYVIIDPEKALGRSIGMPLLGELTIGEPDDVKELTDGARLELAGLELSVAHAPGHTKGSVTFGLPEAADIPSILFSGDLLFAGSIGPTDLPGGDMAEMLDSLGRVCLPLDD